MKKVFLMVAIVGVSLSMTQMRAMDEDRKEDAESLVLLTPEQATDELWNALLSKDCSEVDRVMLVRAALSAHADIQSEFRNYTPLPLAAGRGFDEIVTLLLDRGADMASGGAYGCPALHTAIIKGNVGTVKILLERGCDVNQIHCGEIPLIAAVLHAPRACYDEIARMLISAGADEKMTELMMGMQ